MWPPFCQVTRVVMFKPPMWNSGAMTSEMSSRWTSTVCSMLVLFHQMLPCVSIAPLGRPVVPLVYMMMATSSASTGSPCGSGAQSCAA